MFLKCIEARVHVFKMHRSTRESSLKPQYCFFFLDLGRALLNDKERLSVMTPHRTSTLKVQSPLVSTKHHLCVHEKGCLSYFIQVFTFLFIAFYRFS